MKKFALVALLMAVVGCANPNEDYIRADAAAWEPFDNNGWLERKINEDEDWSTETKDALRQLQKGRKARIAHAMASIAPVVTK